MRLVNQAEELSNVVAAMAELVQHANWAHLHIGSVYLTGQQRIPTREGEMTRYLGRLGTLFLAPLSTTRHRDTTTNTLAMSPFLAENRVKSAEDYDQGLWAVSYKLHLMNRHSKKPSKSSASCAMQRC